MEMEMKMSCGREEVSREEIGAYILVDHRIEKFLYPRRGSLLLL